jgi:DNA polymerase II small subunit/DNA polymerase delta subunit B
MGYAGIVTSDMFGLAAALDKHTQELLEKKRQLTLRAAPLTATQRGDLESINKELDGYGFRFSMRDPLFEKYVRDRYDKKTRLVKAKESSKDHATRRTKGARDLIEKAARRVRSEQQDKRKVRAKN